MEATTVDRTPVTQTSLPLWSGLRVLSTAGAITVISSTIYLFINIVRKRYPEGIKGEPLPEKIPWEGEFTLRSDP
jgi:hypothetical protein